MSRWSDQFKNHQIHQTVQQLLEWLNADLEEIDADAESERLRLVKLLEGIDGALKGGDPDLISINSMQQVDQQLRQPNVWQQVQSYSSSGNAQHLRTANDALAGQLSLFQQLAMYAGPPKSREAIKTIEAAYKRFCKAIEKREKEFQERLGGLKSDLDTYQNELAALRKAFDLLKQQTEAAFANWQKEHSDAQSQRSTEFSSSQSERARVFDETISEIRSKAESETDAITKRFEQRLNTSFEAFASTIASLEKDANEKHRSILKVHGLVGRDGVIGGYKKWADGEGLAALAWRIMAVLFFASAAAWLGAKVWFGFGLTQSGEIDWPTFLGSVSVALALIGVGSYSASQSRMHRLAEEQMRWFELEVSAFDPFISSLNEEEQRELKKQLSERLFGKDRMASVNASAKGDAVTASDASSLLSQVVALVKQIKG